MLFRINLTMQEFGLTPVNAWGALPIVLHLYHAAAVEGNLKKSWLDMEVLIIVNTPQRVFVGDRPDKPQEYLKRFLLVMGYSTTAFSVNRRSTTRPTASQRGPRQVLA